MTTDRADRADRAGNDETLLIVGGDVVTMSPRREVVTGATVAVAGGRIAAIGPAAVLRRDFPGAVEIDAGGCVVIPGLINAHQHTTADPLVRSMIPDDLGSQESIFDWIVPLHGKVTGDDDELFTGAAELAERLEVGLTWHISPGEADVHAYARRSGRRPVLHFEQLGVLGPRLLLGHAVWLDDAELDALVETRTAVASCPGAYLRLGQGYTRAGRHAEFVGRGGRLALGCDSHNAGDVPDLLRAAWLLAALERDRDTQPVLRADQAFALATVDGAAAVGLGDLVGSIEVGKAADLVVLDTGDPTWTPRGDLATHLVWGAPSHTVRDVLVDGRPVVRDRRITTVDLEALSEEAEARSAELLRRTGIGVPHRWQAMSAEDYAQGVRG